MGVVRIRDAGDTARGGFIGERKGRNQGPDFGHGRQQPGISAHAIWPNVSAERYAQDRFALELRGDYRR